MIFSYFQYKTIQFIIPLTGKLQIPDLLNCRLTVVLHFPRLHWKPPLLRVNIELCIVGHGVLWPINVLDEKS